MRFILGALQSASDLQCQIRIKDIHRVYYAIALGYRKKLNQDSRRAIALVESELHGMCPECSLRVSGDILSAIGTMQGSGGKMIFLGRTGETTALVAGKCASAGCTAREMILTWR
jgi:hypothetical protein